MRTLSIDFAAHDGHIACVDGDAAKALRPAFRVNDTAMIPLLEGVLEDAGWTKDDVERIACSVGPGGFTSVRGGVAFANALADRLGVPAGGWHGSALALARCPAALWMHSTKADALFALGGPWTEPTLVTLADALAAAKGGVTVTGDLTEAHRGALAGAGAAFPEPAGLERVLPAFLDALSYQKGGLAPWYGRGL